MPIDNAWQARVDSVIKPYGTRLWSDAIFKAARGHLSGIDHPVLLEAGCGSESWITGELRSEFPTMHVTGIDTNPECLENKQMDKAIVASVYDIPLEDNSVDLVLSAWVLEHLDQPKLAFEEMYRVLKPGGRLIAWAPNFLNPAMWVSALTSNKFHTLIRRLTLDGDYGENAPTYYRMNTLRQIKATARNTGFVYEWGETYSNAYLYFRMSKITYVPAALISKLFALWPLTMCRSILICEMQKPVR